MKKISSFVILFLVAFAGFSQTDTSLNRRLQEYTRLNRELNFSALMEYIHPSLFTLAPKDQMVELFQNVYDNDDMKITIENLENRSISEPFNLKGVQYRKVDYFMTIHMKFKDDSKLSDTGFVNTMISSLRTALPKKQINFDLSTKAFVIKGNDVLMAIKDDPKTDWFFLGYDDSNEMVKTLFPKELVEHFKL